MTDRKPQSPSSRSGAKLPVESLREQHPVDPRWRADGLVGSRHSRLADELRRPLESHDVAQARRICGEISRLLMRDLSPALILLPRAQRYRLQALTAYGLTLFDFVRQTGLEGERLAAINRWEFLLEEALEGKPTGQPVFVLLADVEKHQPWQREGFDQLHAVARRRCAVPRPADLAALEQESLALAEAVTTAFLGATDSHLVAWVAAVLRVGSLVGLGEDLRRHQARLPVSELPDAWASASSERLAHLDRLLQAECARLVPAVTNHRGGASAPRHLRHAIEYVRLACLDLLRQVERRGAEIAAAPPGLSLTVRLRLLALSRWRKR